MMSSALLWSLLSADWTLMLFILVCSFISSAPRLDPANLTGKQTPPITICPVLHGDFPCKAFFKEEDNRTLQSPPDEPAVSLIITY